MERKRGRIERGNGGGRGGGRVSGGLERGENSSQEGGS